MSLDPAKDGLLVKKVERYDGEEGEVTLIELAPKGSIYATDEHRMFCKINPHPSAPFWKEASKINIGDRILYIAGWPVDD